jgi:DNA-binding PadR family transcriptional regulator
MSAIDFNGLDTAVHGPLRLGVLTALQTQGAKDFSSLKQMLAATDGALGMHLQKLEETGYIKCQKAFVGRKPKSTYTITAAGRRALLKYVDTLQAIVDLVHNGSSKTP